MSAAISLLLGSARTSVAPSGTLSGSFQAIGSSLDLDSFTDWTIPIASSGGGARFKVIGGSNIIGNATAGSVGRAVAGGTWPTLTATDSEDSGGTAAGAPLSTAAAEKFFANVAFADDYTTWTIPSTTSLQTVRIHWGTERNDGFSTQASSMTFSLADASASPLTIQCTNPANGATTAERYDLTFKSLAASTLTIKIQSVAVSSLWCVQLIALV